MEIKKCKSHKDIKSGYMEWMGWSDGQMKKGARQKQCPICKRWFWPEEY